MYTAECCVAVMTISQVHNVDVNVVSGQGVVKPGFIFYFILFCFNLLLSVVLDLFWNGHSSCSFDRFLCYI